MRFHLTKLLLGITTLTVLLTPSPSKAQVTWERLSGCANSIGVGYSNTAWVVGCGPKVAGGWGIYYRYGKGWKKVKGEAEDIAVSPGGNPWVVNAQGNIYKWDGSSFQRKLGCANDIGVGNYDNAWIIGCGTKGAGGWGIYQYTNIGWVKVSGEAEDIAVAPDGTPWVVNSQGHIYKRSGGSWRRLPGCANDIGVGANNTAWVIGCGPKGTGGWGIYYWTGSGWQKVNGASEDIAVSPEGIPWLSNAQGHIYRRYSEAIECKPGKPC